MDIVSPDRGHDYGQDARGHPPREVFLFLSAGTADERAILKQSATFVSTPERMTAATTPATPTET